MFVLGIKVNEIGGNVESVSWRQVFNPGVNYSGIIPALTAAKLYETDWKFLKAAISAA